MEISTLTLKLIFLLIPGAIAATIYKRLTVRQKERSNFSFVIVSIILGTFSYLGIQLFFSSYACIHDYFSSKPIGDPTLDSFKTIFDTNNIPYKEIIWAGLFSIIVGFVSAKIDHSKIIVTIARYLNVTNKYGDENLYSYFLNSPDISWVYVRDLKNNLTYLGVIGVFSETDDIKELLLKQVTVYSYPDSQELYDLDNIYLCFPKDSVIIEQAKILQNG